MARLEYGLEICDGCGICETTGSVWEVDWRKLYQCGMYQCYGLIDLIYEICEQERYHERLLSHCRPRCAQAAHSTRQLPQSCYR
jgi:hypothetical protein